MKKKISINLIKKLRNKIGIGISKCKELLINSNGDIDLAIENIRKLGKEKFIQKLNNKSHEGLILIKISKDKQNGVILELNCETDFVSKNNDFKLFADKILNIIFSMKLNNIKQINSYLSNYFIDVINKFSENIYISRIKYIKGNFISYYIHNNRIGVLVSFNYNHIKLVKQIAMHIIAKNPKYININDIPKEIINKEKKIQLEIAKKISLNNIIINKIILGRMKKFYENNVLLEQNFIMDLNKKISSILDQNKLKINKFILYKLGEIK